MSSIRCTIVSPYFEQRGGAELSLMHALHYGADHGIEWSLAVPAAGAISQVAERYGIPTALYGVSRMSSPRGYFTAVSRISKLVRQVGPELLLAWDAFEQFRVAAVAAFTGVPSAWFQKGGVSDNRRSRWQARLPALAILANSPFTARRQQSLIRKVGKSRPIYVVPSAVDLQEFDTLQFSPQACRDELALPAQGPLIVIVGRLQRWKGFHVLIDAMATVRMHFPTARAVLVGGTHVTESDYADQLTEQAQRLGLQNAIVQTGFVQHEQIAKYMQAADVMVHASVDEPFGIVVIEALALGKPLIAANGGGPADVITDGVNGLLADPKSPGDLANKILRILRDRELAESLGEYGRQRARDYSVEKFVGRLSQALQDIVSHKHSEGIIADPVLGKRTASLVEVALP